MSLYQPYLDQLQGIMNMGVQKEQRAYPHIGTLPEREVIKRINEGLRLLDTPQKSLQSVADLFGIRPHKLPKLAPHPDFEHLKHSEGMTEEHYIVSLFVDVKGSTNLFGRLTKEQVHGIVNIVNRAATHTMTVFGASIQRIMFDGVFCYFGGRHISQQQAATDAIHGATMFCHFMQDELPAIFEAYGLEKVTARVGIDLGEAEDVLWGLHGTVDCGELSTTSLHTSLAAKMQQEASVNGIVAGKHIRDWIEDKTFPYFKAHEKRYIFQASGFNYAQYHFNWLPYLQAVLKNAAQLRADGTLLINSTRAGFGLATAPNLQMNDLGSQIRLMEAGQGGAFVTPKGQIISTPTSIPVPKNSFYGDGD